MTSLAEWNERTQRELAEIRREGDRLAKAATAIRGRGEARGVVVEVNAEGDITNLQIAPGVMRWSSTQLTSTLLDCHRQARANAAAEAERILKAVDPRLQNQIRELKGETTRLPRRDDSGRPMTEEQIQAADDAYFDRMNQGWGHSR
ncbi:hypothetical protein DFR70_110226 [Nocardia tenerifensis]|uniref:YbaB/EbfC DNA-binding family protein n=1 Tax=Nocardia tenerifensis TaxID=228006 RepID=A0A318JUG2_9NOCA|nr:YbaB/EbfC family nucleoid-associated protein [Nocardia tenerifensis]PXX60384.1 hypothetical protein DFR70_110226 [Nocardia tenerifensis]